MREYRAKVRRADHRPDRLVDAAPARAHLEQLRRLAVGMRSISAASDVSATTIVHVLTGRYARIRASSAERLLAVDVGARAGGARVSSKAARACFARLLKRGFGKCEIARLLGARGARATVSLGERCLYQTEVDLARIERRAARGELKPTRLVPARLAGYRRATTHELLTLRDRGVRMVAGAELAAELAELRRMRRAG